MSEQVSLQGSCQCGEVKFFVVGDFASFFLCHCSRCQKDTGSAHGANIFLKSADLQYSKGEHLISSYTIPGSRHTRYFCKNCACPVAGPVKDYPLVAIPAGSLDLAPDLKPTAKICMDSRAPWVDYYQKNNCTEYPALPNL